MRLTEAERVAIREAVAEVYGPTAVVRLFGSRVHDHLRGGDIDLHVEADDAEGALGYRRRIRLGSLLETPLDEARIDIIESTRGHALSGIEEVAYREGVRIEAMQDAAAGLVREALAATRPCLAALQRSLQQVSGVLPATAGALARMSLKDADRVAAFLKRFENLVEVSRKQLFRAALVLAGEEHEHASARQIRERLGELELLSEPNEWAEVVEARHRAAHVHPAGDVRAADALNEAYRQARAALHLIGPMPDELERRFGPQDGTAP